MGFFLFAMAAMGGCVADSAANERNDEAKAAAPAQETYVKMSPEAVARLRADRASGAISGPEIPEGAEILVKVGGRDVPSETVGTDETAPAAAQAVLPGSCDVQSIWNSVPVTDTVMVCAPQPVTVNEKVICDIDNEVNSQCGIGDVGCNAQGYQGGPHHAVSKPASAPNITCTVGCPIIKGEEQCKSTPANCQQVPNR
jgi:hypothetical protein